MRELVDKLAFRHLKSMITIRNKKQPYDNNHLWALRVDGAQVKWPLESAIVVKSYTNVERKFTK